MSWLFSQALVEEYSAPNSVAIASCAQLNVMPTPHKFWRKDKTMEFTDLSRFGLTLHLLTEGHGEALLKAFLAAFPVRTYPLPEKVPGLTESEAGCGESTSASFAKFDPASSEWKTRQLSLLGDLEPFSGTWPSWGFMRNGECWERTTSAPTTTATASGSLPTPTARDYKDGTAPRYRDGVLQRDTLGRALGGPPNPEFVEWLMGWPIGWTDLSPLAMDRFLEWKQQHQKSSIAGPDLEQAA